MTRVSFPAFAMRAGRFSYFRCRRCDGRFTPFFQFLREKQFVRSLSPAELQTVRAQVRQIRCSECGAPIDLEHSSQCKYCHAPVSLLDADAVEKATRVWSEAENRRQRAPTPQAVQNVLQQVKFHHEDHANSGTGLALDLVSIGIHAIARLL